MDRVSQYRLDAEHIYVSLLLLLLNQGRLELDVGWLVRMRLWDSIGNYLNVRQQVLELSPQSGLAIEYEVAQALLAYLQAVKQRQNYHALGVGLNILADKQKELNLQPRTVQMINAWWLSAANIRFEQRPFCPVDRSSPFQYAARLSESRCFERKSRTCGSAPCLLTSDWPLRQQSYCCERSASVQMSPCCSGTASTWPAYSERLRQYDHALVQAMRQEGVILKPETQRELWQLQQMLEIAAEDVMMPEEIRSMRQVNYTRLWRLLKANQWAQANLETQRLMLEAAERQDYGWLSLLDLQTFPCVDLHTMDFLWMKFSNGRFSLSVQRQIWWRYREIERFAEKVDWLRGKAWITPTQLDCSARARPGHLPALPLTVTDGFRANYMEALMQRLDQCPMSAA